MTVNKTRTASIISITLLGLLYVNLLMASDSGLIDLLIGQLGVTEQQATGGAGSIFQYAKSKLSPAEFGQVANAVPNMNSLLKAAPTPSSMGDMGGSMHSKVGGAVPNSVGSMLGGKSGSVEAAGGLASLAGAFSKLGLSPEMVQQFVPPILSYVEKTGGAAVKNLLASVLM